MPYPNQPSIIAIDLDGTLVHPGGTISPANHAALMRARQAGARIVIATGRRHNFAMQVLRTVPLVPEDIVLSSNGTVARTVGGELLFRRPMPLETARILCNELGDFRDSFVLTFDLLGPNGEDLPGALVLEEIEVLHGSIRTWIEANRQYLRVVQPILHALPETEDPDSLPIQAMLCGTQARMTEAENLLRSTHDERLSLFRTEYPARDLCILDILPAGCSKGSGLQLLLEANGLTRDHLMSIGDNFNDLPMLELARWPYLMANAPAPLRELAQQRGWTITDAHHHEDGVAEAIQAFFA